MDQESDPHRNVRAATARGDPNAQKIFGFR
jgi:hypothetical protein